MIESTVDDGVAHIVLSRPQRRNAVHREGLEELRSVLVTAHDGGARVVVLSGADGNFCAGADLTTVEDEDFVATLRRVLVGLRDSPVPTIAAVEGAALGAGTQLAAACDLRTATDDASFGIPAAKLGLMVDQWTVERLVHEAGSSLARAMLVGAMVCSGEDAHRQGFVQRRGDVAAALRWARELAALAPLTVAGHKLGCNEVEAGVGDSPAYRAAWERAWASSDLQEGLAAFHERRTPRFEGR